MKIALAVLALGIVAFGCDRRTEPFVVGEKPHDPDLSLIFPEGAERAARPTAGLPAAPGQRGAPAVSATVGDDAAPIRGSVTLAPELAGRVPPGAVLFLIARSSNPGPPLAVQKIENPSFPLQFSIGPDDRMIREMPFVGPVRISARLDADGNATTRELGDLSGESAAEQQPGATGVSVAIDEVYAPAAPAAAAGGAGGVISGTIAISPELADRVPDGSVLFVIARTGAGGPPLAVKRMPTPRFPFEFSIGPDDRILAARPFAGPVRLSARIDADGDATSRSSGDLSGEGDREYAPGDRGVVLTIDQAAR